MNKKIKVIELLNKIAKGEEIPRHIKYEYYQYDWSDNSRDYICEKADGESLHMFNDGYICILCNTLNDEVEILEDNTEEIEELEYEESKMYCDTQLIESTKTAKQEDIIDKINQLVKAVNEIRKDLNK